MFKRFNPDNDVSTSTQVKSSMQRSIKSQLCGGHPGLITQEIVDELFPKHDPLTQYKVGPHLMLYCFKNGEPALFQARDGPVLPVLRLVHSYQDSLEFVKVTVDKGAIPFILGGANIMCPGLTNEGGIMPPDNGDTPALPAGQPVIIYAEGKHHAIAVGTMKLSSLDVRRKNKGIAIDVAHYLGDGLFQTKDLS